MECCVLTIPRIVDLSKESYVVVENADLMISATNSSFEDGSVMFYGIGYINDSGGNSTLILGLNFFDLSSLDKDSLKNGRAVYAKFSGQLIGFEHYE